MKQDLKDYLRDSSSDSSFQFSIICENCHGTWKSRKVSFSHANKSPESEGKRIVYKTLYEREKMNALANAVKEAREVFSQCPICNRIVCDECFLLCDEIDMCCECAVRLKQRGLPITE